MIALFWLYVYMEQMAVKLIKAHYTSGPVRVTGPNVRDWMHLYKGAKPSNTGRPCPGCQQDACFPAQSRCKIYCVWRRAEKGRRLTAQWQTACKNWSGRIYIDFGFVTREKTSRLSIKWAVNSGEASQQHMEFWWSSGSTDWFASRRVFRGVGAASNTTTVTCQQRHYPEEPINQCTALLPSAAENASENHASQKASLLCWKTVIANYSGVGRRFPVAKSITPKHRHSKRQLYGTYTDTATSSLLLLLSGRTWCSQYARDTKYQKSWQLAQGHLFQGRVLSPFFGWQSQ